MADQVQKSILIAIPTLDVIKTETVSSLFASTAVTNYPASLHIHTSCYVHDARNKSVAQAIRMGVTHLMFIDSDMQFPKDGINRLMEQDKDVIAGLYFRRQPPHLPTIHQRVGTKLVIPHKFPTDKPFQVYGLATGFMLIKVEVLKQLKPPYFFFGNFHGREMGEDIYFCHKVKEKGFEIWCDPTIELGHVGMYSYGKQDYDAYQDIRPKDDTEDFGETEIP